MGCKGTCSGYKKYGARFDTASARYCTICSTFMEWDGVYCPCCQRKLRQKTRPARRRRWLHKHGEHGRADVTATRSQRTRGFRDVDYITYSKQITELPRIEMPDVEMD